MSTIGIEIWIVTDQYLNEYRFVFQEQLFTKRDKLAEQLSEAKKLKQNIDKRSLNVSRILQKYLSDEQFMGYQNFIKTKTKLIIETRIINDKITLSEEQLNALKE